MRDKGNCLWTIVPSDNFRDSIMIKCFRNLLGGVWARFLHRANAERRWRRGVMTKGFLTCNVCGFQKDGDKRLRVGDRECSARKNYGGFGVLMPSTVICTCDLDSCTVSWPFPTRDEQASIGIGHRSTCDQLFNVSTPVVRNVVMSKIFKCRETAWRALSTLQLDTVTKLFKILKIISLE